MSRYATGIDLGTTFASAAIYRDGTTTAIDLEDDGRVSPSVIAPLGCPEQWLVGNAALAKGPPLVRRFKRELGRAKLYAEDGRSLEAEDLLAAQLRWVLGRLAAELGTPPDAVTLTHPASWGPDRLARFKRVARDAGLPQVSYRDEPLAAATFFASQTAVLPGDAVAVYDLGGGTTDVTVMRREAEGFVALANSGTDRGSVDFDDLIAGMVEDRLGGSDEIDSDALDDAASKAKISLSSEQETSIAVVVRGNRMSVPVTADEVRTMVHPLAMKGVNHLLIALRQARVDPEDLAFVLLAGGGCAMPLIADLIAEHVGRAPQAPPWPKMSVAYGAAIAAAGSAGLLVASPKRPPHRTDLEQSPTSSPVGPDDEAVAPSTPIVVDTSTLTRGPSLVDLRVDSDFRRPVSALLELPDEPRGSTAEPVRSGGVSTRDALVVALIIVAAIVGAVLLAAL